MASDASDLFSDDSSQGFDFGEEQERNIEFTPYDLVYEVCRNDRQLPEKELVEQLERILETDSDVLLETNEFGDTMLRYAIAYKRSLNFCKLLIDHNPDLVRTTDNDGSLPIHSACLNVHNEMIKFLIDQYPESVNITDGDSDLYPVHCYIFCDGKRLDVLQLLLKCDEEALSATVISGNLALHSAVRKYDSVDMISAVFNAYPQALYIQNDRGHTPMDIARRSNMDDTILDFLDEQVELANQARQLTIPDAIGQLPIHQTLQRSNISYGTIKLMVAVNPTSINVADSEGIIPLHVASRCVDSSIVKFLVEQHNASLNISDSKGNYALHHACAGGNCDVVNFILSLSSQGVSMRNKDGKLPFELLVYEGRCDFFDEERDQEYGDTQEYVEAVYHLLCLYPDALRFETSS